jgi:hypothetical protein
VEETIAFQCPHCWQTIEMNVDVFVREQSYVQDCEVCCNPIQIRYSADGETVTEFSAEPAQ